MIALFYEREESPDTPSPCGWSMVAGNTRL